MAARPAARPWARVAGLAVLALLAGCGGRSGSTAPPASPSPSSTPGASTRAAATATTPPSPTATPTTAVPRPTVTRGPTTAPPTTAQPPAATAARVLWRGATTRRVVVLTFDAGSDAGRTAQVLDVLQSRGVPATFGLTGAWVRANPALARRIAAAGHQVVNHTDRHLSFTGRSTGTGPLTRAQRVAALAAAERSIVSTTGTSTHGWMRPPYGDRDAGVDLDVGIAGYRYELMWTVDTLGWKGVPAATVTRRVLDALVPGEIVLMHVGAASTDASALPGLIDALRDRGYGFVRADGL